MAHADELTGSILYFLYIRERTFGLGIASALLLKTKTMDL